MKKVILTVIINLWIPITVGVAQNPGVFIDSVLTNHRIKLEIDSIREQINLNLDLLEYRINKDSIKTKQNDTDK